jgi:Ala-tRNA(Pro) deacylase
MQAKMNGHDGTSGLGMEEAPAERLRRFLEENGVAFELIEHKAAFTALAEAREAGLEADDVAKGVLLHTEDGYALAVIPASARLDLDKARAVIGSEVEPATEAELAVLFPDHELGAIPLLGRGAPKSEFIDEQLLGHDWILCNGGDHRHSVLISPADLAELTSAGVADLIVN